MEFGLDPNGEDIPRTYVTLAEVAQSSDPTVGYMYLDDKEEVMVEVKLHPDGGRRSAYLGLIRRDGVALGLVPVRPGDTVALEWPDGEEGHPIIVSRVRSANPSDKSLPTVAGLSMTVVGDPPRPRVATVYRGGTGEPIAVQGDRDVLVHAGGQVELRAANLHLDGTVHLGRPLQTRPTAPIPGPNQVEGGTPGTGYEPPPYVTPGGTASVLDAIVRVQDPVISNTQTDALFWGWFVFMVQIVKAVALFLGIPIPPPLLALDPTAVGPTSLTSKPNGASKHTASGA